MSVELSILNKALTTKELGLLDKLDDTYFPVYKTEYNFIKQHYNEYGVIPDKVTVLDKFPDFGILDVYESDEYLLDEISEQHLYGEAVPVIQQVANLLQTNSAEAVEFLKAQATKLQLPSRTVGVDIVQNFDKRYDEYEKMSEDRGNFVIPTGFKELDDLVGGWSRGEEFVVIFARTGQGKSWIMIKSLMEAWRAGYRVGIIEPEMSVEKTGYRFDSLYGNISNRALMRGEPLPTKYKEYGEELKTHENPFVVATPREFGRRITVSKLRNFVKSHNLDMLGIDGISYLTDERFVKGDNRTTSLTNISEDLMDLSIELKIPILVVAQSNREGVREDVPGLENIRDSDGIAYNCSVALSARSKDGILELQVQKNRNGNMGNKLTYSWVADTGDFAYINENEDLSAAEPYKTAVGTDVF